MSEKDRLIAPSSAGDVAFAPQASFSDHFSLEAPSDEIRFRSSCVRVYTSGTQQFQIVEEENKCLKAKVTSDGSSGLSMLRACYTLVTVLMMGFLLVFCVQVLLFLFVSLAMQGGFTSKQSMNWFHLLGTMLSVPIFVYGLSSALTMATEFVIDTWHGHQFFRSVLRISAVFIDWFSFLAFLGVPLVVMICNMFTNEHWWEPTALTWFACVSVSFCLFCLTVFFIEIWGALELLAHHKDYELIGLDIKLVGVFLKRAILLRQLQGYSGVRHRTFYIEGGKAFPSANDSYDQSELADHEHTQESMSWYAKLTQKLPDKWFFEYETPKRQFNVEDVLDRTVFVTDSSWNLEKLFCQRQKARSVLVVNGRSRLTVPQVISSLICAILGNFLIVVLFASLISWVGASAFYVIVLTALFLAANRDAFHRIYVIYDTYQDTVRRREATGTATSDAADSEAIYQVTETHRVTRPSEKLCWILFGCELVFLFVFPLWMLCDVGNRAIAILFAILGFFSACRHYFNAPIVLSELGSLDLLDGQFIRGGSTQERSAPEVAEEDWREKNRLSKIVGRISQGGRRDFWIGVIVSFVLIFQFLFLSAFGQGSNNGDASEASNLLHDFQYTPKKNTFKYPTCSMTADFQLPGSNSHAMADYAYMASIAYVAPESMPDMLEAWFGEGVAHDNVENPMRVTRPYTTSSLRLTTIQTLPL
jgi:hypothetical protein